MSSNLTSAASSPKTLPPVATAMSWRVFLRLSPNPGALTAATWRPILSRLTTRVVKASPSMSSAMMIRGRLCWNSNKAGQKRIQERCGRLRASGSKLQCVSSPLFLYDSQGNDNIITQVDKGQFLSATTHSINVAKLSRTKKLINSLLKE